MKVQKVLQYVINEGVTARDLAQALQVEYDVLIDALKNGSSNKLIQERLKIAELIGHARCPNSDSQARTFNGIIQIIALKEGIAGSVALPKVSDKEVLDFVEAHKFYRVETDKCYILLEGGE